MNLILINGGETIKKVLPVLGPGESVLPVQHPGNITSPTNIRQNLKNYLKNGYKFKCEVQ